MKKVFVILLSVVLLMSFLPTIAFAGDKTPVTNIHFEVEKPVKGEHPFSDVDVTANPSDSVFVAYVIWLSIPVANYTGANEDTWTIMDDTDVFQDGYYYYVNIKAMCNSGYGLGSSLETSINDGSVNKYELVSSIPMPAYLFTDIYGGRITNAAGTITPPRYNDTPDVNPTITTTDACNVSIYDVEWWSKSISDYENGTGSWDALGENDIFEPGYVYSVDIYANIPANFLMEPSVTGTVNGLPHDDSYGIVYHNSSTLCLSYTFEDILPDLYPITIGDGQEVMIDGVSSLLVTCSGTYSKFTGFKIDDEIVDPSNYSSQEGSTFVNVKNSFLSTLALGSHTFQFMYTDGTSPIGHFTTYEEPFEDDPSAWSDVPEQDEDQTSSAKKSPKTNDLSLGFMLLLVSGAIVTTKMKKK